MTPYEKTVAWLQLTQAPCRERGHRFGAGAQLMPQPRGGWLSVVSSSLSVPQRQWPSGDRNPLGFWWRPWWVGHDIVVDVTRRTISGDLHGHPPVGGATGGTGCCKCWAARWSFSEWLGGMIFMGIPYELLWILFSLPHLWKLPADFTVICYDSWSVFASLFVLYGHHPNHSLSVHLSTILSIITIAIHTIPLSLQYNLYMIYIQV